MVAKVIDGVKTLFSEQECNKGPHLQPQTTHELSEWLSH